jgi:hypothetical protein
MSVTVSVSVSVGGGSTYNVDLVNLAAPRQPFPSPSIPSTPPGRIGPRIPPPDLLGTDGTIPQYPAQGLEVASSNGGYIPRDECHRREEQDSEDGRESVYGRSTAATAPKGREGRAWTCGTVGCRRGGGGRGIRGRGGSRSPVGGLGRVRLEKWGRGGRSRDGHGGEARRGAGNVERTVWE